MNYFDVFIHGLMMHTLLLLIYIFAFIAILFRLFEKVVAARSVHSFTKR